jgi:hypothetical protein
MKAVSNDLRSLFSALLAVSAIGLATVGAPGNASAEQPEDGESSSPDQLPFSTDRPGFSEGSSTVPTNHLQIEGGAEAGLGSNFSTVSPISILGRYGIADIAELRLGFTPASLAIPSEGSTQTTALSDVTFGGRVAGSVTDDLNLGILPYASVGQLVDDPSVSAGAIGTASYGLSENVGLAANVGAAAVPVLDDYKAELSASLVASFSLPAGFGTYIEAYNIQTLPSDPQFFANGGVTYLVAPNFQLDAYVDTDVPDTDIFTFGLGASVLL